MTAHSSHSSHSSSPRPEGSGPEQSLSTPRQYPVTGNAFGWPLIVLSLLQLMVVLDGTVVNLALAKIHVDLHLSDLGRSWVIIAYALAYGGLLLLGGRLGDALGRKRVFLWGVGLFTAASLVCGLAINEAMLLSARVVQGMGAAVASPTAMALIVTTFAPGRTRAQAFSTFAAMTGLGSVVGLVVGGALTELSWRWIFLINVPIGLLIIGAGIPALAVAPVTQRIALDVRGAVLATAGSTILVFGMTAASTSTVTALVCVIVGVVVLAVFVATQRGNDHAIIPLDIFSNRARSAVFVCLLLAGGLMMAMTVQVALFVQEVLGYSSLRAGVAFLPFAVAMVVGFGTAGRLSETVAPRWIITAGGAIMIAGFCYGARLTPESSYWPHLVVPICVIGVGVGMVMIPLTLSVVAGATPEDVGPLSALSLVSQTVGGPVGLALATVVSSRIAIGRMGESAYQAADRLHLTAAAKEAIGAGYAQSLYVCAGFAVIIVIIAVALISFTPTDIAEGKAAEEASHNAPSPDI